MAKVVITETDLTSHLEEMNEVTDIAYVPGFGDTSNDTELAKLGIHLYQNPRFISTISQFKKLYGERPRVIKQDYKFADHYDAWDPNSYDDETYLIQGTASSSNNSSYTYAADPGYLYALELLKAGMPIFYERLNPGPYDRNYKGDLFTVTIGSGDIWTDSEGLAFNDEQQIKATFDCNADSKSDKKTTTVEAFMAEWDTTKSITLANGSTETIKYSKNVWEAFEIAYCTAEQVYNCFYNTDGIDKTKSTTWTKFGAAKVPFNSTFLKLIDKGTFSIKYLTSGGWPVFDYLGENAYSKKPTDKDAKDAYSMIRPVMEIMLRVCSQTKDWTTMDFRDQVGRGDCIALIDHTNYPDRPLDSDDATSVFGTLNGVNRTNHTYNDVGESIIPGVDSLSKHEVGSFGAMFTPWENYTLDATVRNCYTNRLITKYDFPASFAYLKDMAYYINAYNKNHEAVAGPIRGRVKNATPRTNRILTNTIADSYQPVIDAVSGGDEVWNNLMLRSAINAITNIHPYGETIWGNRTLAPKSDEEGVKATHFLNIRNMVSDIRKAVFIAARKYMFEQNSDVLWINFKTEIEPTLDNLKTNYGIRDYRILKTKQENVKLWADIIIQPIYAVEEFKVNITIQDDDIVVNDDLTSVS